MDDESLLHVLWSFDEESSDSDIDFSFSSSALSESSESDRDLPAKKCRLENYLSVIDNYTDIQFREHFRVKRIVAERIKSRYANYRHRENHEGRKECQPELEIFLTLWYLANTETYRQLSDRFNVTRSSVFRILHRVIEWIVTESYLYIKWPTASEVVAIKSKFYNLKNFPRVIGAIDGCHIRVHPPKVDRQAYYNRKKYYSVLLQGIVGPDKRFIDIHCGEPGSMHDARLFRKSKFYFHVNNQPNLISTGDVLLGDSAYPATNYLVTPYKDFGNLTPKQRKFNYLHSATRIVVENAFGLLKSRFRRLKFFESPNIGFVTNCIVAACVLHNICISENDEDITLDTQDESPDNVETTEVETTESTGMREVIYLELDNMQLLG